MKKLCGSDRVIGGQKLPVHAWKLNNQKPIQSDEILIRVIKLHLENGSFNQICMEVGGNEEQIKECILKNELPFMLNRPSDDSNNATLASVKPHGPQDDQK